MKRQRFKFRLLVFFLVFLFTAGVAHAEDARSLLERVDKLYRSNSSHAEMEMEVITGLGKDDAHGTLDQRDGEDADQAARPA